MESQEIEILLSRYLEGETSLKEEEKLKEYFTSGEVAPHLQEYTPMFSFFINAREECLERKINFQKEKKRTYSWVAVAASVVIVAGLFFNKPQPGHELGSYEDPKLALEETKEALYMVSRLMNNGKEDLAYIKEFNRTKNSFLK